MIFMGYLALVMAICVAVGDTKAAICVYHKRQQQRGYLQTEAKSSDERDPRVTMLSSNVFPDSMEKCCIQWFRTIGFKDGKKADLDQDKCLADMNTARCVFTLPGKQVSSLVCVQLECPKSVCPPGKYSKCNKYKRCVLNDE